MNAVRPNSWLAPFRARIHTAAIIWSIGLMLLTCSGSKLVATDAPALPELREGDAILCEPYPYRTVTNTSRTVYQLARLGFDSVRSFQQGHGMKVDGIIGPRTQGRVEAEYSRRFGPPALGGRSKLSVSVQARAVTNGIAATVTVGSVSATPVRVVGSLTLDQAHRFRFSAASVLLVTKTCLRRDDFITTGGRSYVVTLSKQVEAMAGSLTLPPLGPTESGRIVTKITYFGSDLAEQNAEMDAELPIAPQK